MNEVSQLSCKVDNECCPILLMCKRSSCRSYSSNDSRYNGDSMWLPQLPRVIACGLYAISGSILNCYALIKQKSYFFNQILLEWVLCRQAVIKWNISTEYGLFYPIFEKLSNFLQNAAFVELECITQKICWIWFVIG